MNNPSFSIILPCYNQIDFLKEAVDSVQKQSFRSWELLLINDGSTDLSGELAEELASFDSRIRVFHQSNQGLSCARNLGLKLANGDYLGFLDGDDIYFSNALENVFSSFLNFDADLIIGGYKYFDNNSFFHTHQFSISTLPPSFILERNQAPPVAHFLKREMAMKIGEFDPSLKSCEDWDYWIRAGKLGAKVITISDVIAGYRYVSNSMSRNAKVMYNALSEVSRRSFHFDERLPKTAPFNIDIQVDLSSITKQHLIRCLGVMIHQKKSIEAAQWFEEEKKTWDFKVIESDWQGLSSSLSWRYFFNKIQIQDVFSHVKPSLELFFRELGYSNSDIARLVSDIIRPQRYKMNHYRYGKWIGALINRLSS